MDVIIRTLICSGQVSLTVIETTDLVNRAAQIHNLTGRASSLLGGMLTCAAYIASSLKEESGSVSLTVKAKDSDGAVSVSADKNLHVRGYVDGSCTDTLTGGSLTVVREHGYFRPFNGTCEILSDDISDLLETYYGQSEQIPTAVAISTQFDGDGKCLWAGGVVMQLLPDASDEAIDKAGELFSEYKQSLDGGACGDARTIFNKFFAKLADGAVNEQFPEYKCNCKEKIRGVLISVGKRELLKICEEMGEVRVHCHYCNTDYVYDKESIEENF